MDLTNFFFWQGLIFFFRPDGRTYLPTLGPAF
jgi:hypothetical protein